MKTLMGHRFSPLFLAGMILFFHAAVAVSVWMVGTMGWVALPVSALVSAGVAAVALYNMQDALRGLRDVVTGGDPVGLMALDGMAGPIGPAVADLVSAREKAARQEISGGLRHALETQGSAVVELDAKGVLSFFTEPAADLAAQAGHRLMLGETVTGEILAAEELEYAAGGTALEFAGLTYDATVIPVGGNRLIVMRPQDTDAGGAAFPPALGGLAAMITVGPDGQIAEASPAFETLCQRSSAELQSLPVIELFEAPDGGSIEIGKLAASNGMLDLRLCRQDGSTVQCRAIGNWYEDSGGTMLFSDVSDLVESIDVLRAQMVGMVDQRDDVCANLSAALTELAEGRIKALGNVPDGGDFAALGKAYNAAVETLEWSLGNIGIASRDIVAGVGRLTAAVGSDNTQTDSDLVDRTRAALAELSEGGKKSLDALSIANEVVGRVRAGADDSGQIVQNAIEAMGAIEASSNRISQIIGVIEDIAFQTNLLALNAGVEAARAGDSGRGFAVVATEVRALAQRSSDAAREIKALISESAGHVASGVQLVNRTGDALVQITSEVAAVDEQFSAIAESSASRNRGLDEVSALVSELTDAVGASGVGSPDMKASEKMVDAGIRRLKDAASQLGQSVSIGPGKTDARVTTFPKVTEVASRTRTEQAEAPVPARSVKTRSGAATPQLAPAKPAVSQPLPELSSPPVTKAAASVAADAVPDEIDGGWEDF